LLAILGDQVDLVGLFDRHSLGNSDYEGLSGHIAGVQYSRLIVEIDVVNAGEVVTDDAHDLLHIGLGDDNIFVGIADEIHCGDSRCLDKTVRIINGVAGREEQNAQDQAFICRINFHLGFN